MISVILIVLSIGCLLMLLLAALIWLSGMRKATTGKGGLLWKIAGFFEDLFFWIDIFK